MHVASDWVVVVIRVSSGISVCLALLVPATYAHGSTSSNSEGSHPCKWCRFDLMLCQKKVGVLFSRIPGSLAAACESFKDVVSLCIRVGELRWGDLIRPLRCFLDGYVEMP